MLALTMKDRAILLLVLSNLLLSAGLGYALFFREPLNAQAQSQRKWTSVIKVEESDVKALLSQGYEPFGGVYVTGLGTYVLLRK